MSSDPSERWEKIDAILDRLFALEGDARERELRLLTGDDEDLLRQVRALLDADADRSAEFDSFLEDGAAPLAEEALGARQETAETVLPAGGRIGPYELRRILGTGGMSVVYLARRDDGEFRQDVAVKLLRHPGRHPDLVRRFKVERQILANLDHPGIARILDGGVDDGGWPYLAMEYVDGIPINEYCAQTGASLEHRLDLFEAVCDSVHHAHQRVVVHRDLKPSNILVTRDGQVKLLDFGIAKLLDEGDARFDHTVPMTETGLRLFTPDYAAPEQVRGEAITTATDVYALGVLLYELLAGERPYRLRDRRASEIERVVCDEDPAPPSATALRTGTAGEDTHVDPEARRYRARLRGDLDTICLKALRKEPELRYASALELAEDLRRYRKGLPVNARPATARYRFSKFVRRNRLPVGATALLVVLSLAFAVFATLERERTERARELAELEASKAVAVTDFMLDLFRATDPTQDRGDTLTVRDLLERGVERADAMRSQPLVQADMLMVMGRANREIGRIDRSEELLRRSLALHDSLGNPDPEQRMEVLDVLGRTLALREDFDAAIPMQEQVLAWTSERYGPRDRRTAMALGDLGQSYLDRDNFAPAESLLTLQLDLLRAADDATPADLVAAQSNLAALHAALGDWPLAAAMTESTLARRRRLLGDEHLDVAIDLHNLAVYSRRLGDAEKAERLYREALEIRRSQLPRVHASIARSLDNLAIAIGVQGRYAEAEPLFLEALEIRRELYGEDHRQVASSYSNLGMLMQRTGEMERSLEYAQRAVDTLHRATPEPNLTLVSALRNLASTLSKLGRIDEALAASEEALAVSIQLTGEDSTVTARSRGNLAAVVLDHGDPVRAEGLRRRALEVLRSEAGEMHPDVATYWQGLGAALQAQGRVAEADSCFSRALAIRTEVHGPEHPQTRESGESLATLRGR